MLKSLGKGARDPYLIRFHYLFCSGTALGLPHWGSGNVYSEDVNGNPQFNFSISDLAFDAIIEAGHRPLVELGFTPLAMIDKNELENFPFNSSPTLYGPYEAGAWALPPRDYEKWANLVTALIEHCAERYGRQEVEQWPWELWNEPDFNYWRGSKDQFFELYAVTAKAVKSALPAAAVGGPATRGTEEGKEFLRDFLTYCQDTEQPLDFISFHTKGARFEPWRIYVAKQDSKVEEQSPSSPKMLDDAMTSLNVIADFPRYGSLPCYIDECDASVPAHRGVYDNPNFQYRNTEYFAVFQAKLMKKLLDLNDAHAANIALAMTWSFYFEGERCFEGTRSLLTYGGIEKPVLNAYRMFDRMHELRMPCTSSQAWSEDPSRWISLGMPEEVDALATEDGRGNYSVLVWRHSDDQYHTDDVIDIELEFDGLEIESGEELIGLRQWRIDEQYSNSHTAWRSIGAPMYPNESELLQIRQHQGLEPGETPHILSHTPGRLLLAIKAPLPSLSLVEFNIEG